MKFKINDNESVLVERSGVTTDLLDGKQDVLTFDNVPTSGSNNPVKSGGIYSSMKGIYMGTCSTAGGVSTKVCTVETFSTEGDGTGKTPVIGTVIGVKFSATNTTAATNVKLSVNDTKAASIYYNTGVTSSATTACGYANRYIYYVWDGTYWVWVNTSYDANNTYSNVALGQGYATDSRTSSSSASTAITASLGSYVLSANGIVSVAFTYDVKSGSTLNVNGKGAKNIYYRGAKITDGIIKAGDVATFIYSTYYRLIAIDRWEENVQADWNQTGTTADDYIKNKPTNVSAFNNDAGYLTQHQDLSSYATSANYDSTAKKIYLKHGSTVLSEIDATDFIKDGMVDNVTISTPSSGSHAGVSCLVITFNTDSGKENIEIPISQIFDSSQYYTKSEMAAVATSGNYSDLNGAPTLATVATSGSYNDLTNKPTIPTVNNGVLTIQKEGTAVGTFTANQSSASTINIVETDPTVPAWAKESTKPSYSYSEINGTPTLATVATSGSYNDLTNKPTIPTVNNGTLTIQKEGVAVGSFTANQSSASTINIVETDPTVPSWAKASSKPSYSYSEINGTPTLATVATSGSYNDLTNKPTIPTVNNATLTIQKNGENVQTFTANASSNATANIEVAEPILIEVTGSGTQEDPYVAEGSPYTIVTTALDSFNNPAIWLKYDNEYYQFVKDDTDNNLAAFIHDTGNWLIKKFTVDDNNEFTYSEYNGQSALVSGTNIKTVNGITLLGSGNVAITKRVAATWNNSTNVYDSGMNVDDIYTAVYSQGCVVELHFINGDWNGTVLNCQGGYTDGNARHMIFSGQGSGKLVEADVVGTSVTLTWCSLDDLWGELGGKQPTLVSGTNIKTVNGESLLGSGNVDAEEVVVGKLDSSDGKFYRLSGYTTSGTLLIKTPVYSGTAETGSDYKLYLDIPSKNLYRYNRTKTVLLGETKYEVVSTTDLSSYYNKTEIDTALSGKQDVDDVYVNQNYVDTNTTSSFSASDKRYNIIEEITLTSGATYTFGSGCTVHFYNQGSLNGYADLELNNTQIESPMKQCFDLNVTFTGLMRNSECYPEWWGAVGDGVTDDADAINRCIYNACHTPVVLAAENYLVASTVGPDYKVYNAAVNSAAHTSWSGTYASQFIVKHNIIGDASLAGPVVRYATCYGLCRIEGSILVRNTSDDAVGFTTWTGDGNLSCVNNEISIERIDRGTWPLNGLSGSADGVGLGVGAALSCWDSKIRIYNIRGFKEGCYLSRFGTNDLWVGRNESVYCFYLGAAKSAWYTGSPNWYVHRNKITLGVQISGLPTHIVNASDSSIIKENGAIEIAMNDFTVGDSNNSTPNYRHPHKHSLYYISGGAGHTGNRYRFNITYGTETSRDFIKFEYSSAPTATNSRQPNGDVIEFGVSCFMKDLNIPYGWNVEFKNVLISSSSQSNGSFRWMGGQSEILLDSLILSYESAPTFVSGSNPIKLIVPNEQFEGKIVATDTVPTTCAAQTLYVVDNSTVTVTTNGVKKYPVYCSYFGSGATKIGYSLKNYREKQDNLVSGTNIKTFNGQSILASGNVDTNVARVDVAGGAVSTAFEPNKLYILGTTSTPCTSLTFTLTAGATGYAEYYHAVAFCAANMTLSIPNTVTVAENRALPTFGAGDIFEFEILTIGTNKHLMHFSHTPAS